jgi:hypothetical protein
MLTILMATRFDSYRRVNRPTFVKGNVHRLFLADEGRWLNGSVRLQEAQYLFLLSSCLWRARATTTRVLACKRQWR